MRFLGEHSPFQFESRELKKSPDRNNLSSWIILIVMLIGLNAFAWVFCMYVFGHPETPFNYRLLTRLEKLEPISEFTPITAPRGKFTTAKQLYAEQYEYSKDKLKAINALMKRSYISNYKKNASITYLGGNFVIESIKVLGPDDVFPSGIAIRARAEDYPIALVDYILPIPDINKSPFKAGDSLTISRSDTCAVLLHIEKLPEEEACFTITPLVSRAYQLAGDNALSVSPPKLLNLKGSWPVSPPSSPVQARTHSPKAQGKGKVVVTPGKSAAPAAKN